jgi:hypothetical protein
MALMFETQEPALLFEGRRYPLFKFHENDEKIFLDFRLFFDAGMNKTREKLVKTISDVKKIH